MAEKKVNLNRFYWNPVTKEKVYVEYMDGSKIELNEGQKKKAEEAVLACKKLSFAEAEASVNLRKRKDVKERLEKKSVKADAKKQ